MNEYYYQELIIALERIKTNLILDPLQDSDITEMFNELILTIEDRKESYNEKEE